MSFYLQFASVLILVALALLFLLYLISIFIPEALVKRAAKAKGVDPKEALHWVRRTPGRTLNLFPSEESLRMREKWKHEISFAQGVRISLFGLIPTSLMLWGCLATGFSVFALDAVLAAGIAYICYGAHAALKEYPLLFSAR